MYGILKSSVAVNSLTGNLDELDCVFTAPLQITSNQPSFANDTINLKRVTSVTNIQRWELSAGIMPTETSHELLIHTILNAHHTPFYIRMPQIYRRGVYEFDNNIAIDVKAQALAGTSTITIDDPTGLSDWGTRILPLGEFIRFANHSKVYLVTNSVLSSGQNIITIAPKLVITVPANTDVFYDKRVAMRAYYDKDTNLGLSYQDGILTDIITVRMVEAL
jgi:hypothetical protein